MCSKNSMWVFSSFSTLLSFHMISKGRQKRSKSARESMNRGRENPSKSLLLACVCVSLTPPDTHTHIDKQAPDFFSSSLSLCLSPPLSIKSRLGLFLSLLHSFRTLHTTFVCIIISIYLCVCFPHSFISLPPTNSKTAPYPPNYHQGPTLPTLWLVPWVCVCVCSCVSVPVCGGVGHRWWWV